MAKQKRSAGELSARLRTQLKHLEASAASGEALKDYAGRKGLSVHTLYAAKKDLRKRGAWPATGRGAVKKKPSFSRVQAGASSPMARPGCRLRLPCGAVLEWETTPDPTVLVSVIERVTSAR